jgi:hypothetical protein
MRGKNTQNGKVFGRITAEKVFGAENAVGILLKILQ